MQTKNKIKETNQIIEQITFTERHITTNRKDHCTTQSSFDLCATSVRQERLTAKNIQENHRDRNEMLEETTKCTKTKSEVSPSGQW